MWTHFSCYHVQLAFLCSLYSLVMQVIIKFLGRFFLYCVNRILEKISIFYFLNRNLKVCSHNGYFSLLIIRIAWSFIVDLFVFWYSSICNCKSIFFIFNILWNLESFLIIKRNIHTCTLSNSWLSTILPLNNSTFIIYIAFLLNLCYCLILLVLNERCF